MIAEERAEYIREKLKFQWPGLNGCDALECLIDDVPYHDPYYYYEQLIIPPIKYSWWDKFKSWIKRLFHGKQN